MPRHPRGYVSPGSNGGRSNTRTGVRKRDRYVLHACDRCRAAKVRCNGARPCSYCVPRDPDSCHYAAPLSPQDLARGRQLGAEDVGLLATLMQQQNEKLDMMTERISALKRLHNRHHIAPEPDTASPWAEEPLPLFQSSTSAFYCIRIMDADMRARNEHPTAEPTSPMEINQTVPSTPTSFSILDGQIVGGVAGDAADGDHEGAPITARAPLGTMLDEAHNLQAQPLDHLDCNEIIRLIHKYQDYSGMMYPIVDVAYIEQRVRDSWPNESSNGIESGSSSRLSRDDLATLHVVVAIALAVENENASDLARSLHESLWPIVDTMIWNSRVDLNGLVLLTLMSLYYHYSNKWRLAWRFVGNVTRIILELGLNRQIVLDRSFTDLARHSQAVNTIWSVFVLERQLTYALGLSAAIHDLRIDHSFPRPTDAPYLQAMIQYSRIGAQACDSLLGETHTGGQTLSDDRRDVLSYFQFRLDEWRKAINTEFQFRSGNERTDGWNQKLRTILYLRANNLRLVVARFLLLGDGAQSTASPDVWNSSVDVAADTIQVLASFDGSPSTCRFQKCRSNYFLVAALGVSLLAMLQDPAFPTTSSSSSTAAAAVAAAPPLRNRVPVEPETLLKAQQTAVMCLSLLRSRAESSRQSRCLWERFRGLAARLKLLDFLILPGTPPAAGGDWGRAMPTPGNDELLMGRGGLTVSQEQVDHLAPIVELGFLGLGDGIGDSTWAMDMMPGLDVAFDPAFFANGFGES